MFLYIEDQVATQKQLAVGKKRDRPSSTVASTTTTAGSTKASSRLPLDAKRSSSSKVLLMCLFLEL
ncbi:hypothetical protein EON65_19895 [archaeon]|nr:MAG: hypothetical protein EON65_19895 [archaeon]